MFAGAQRRPAEFHQTLMYNVNAIKVESKDAGKNQARHRFCRDDRLAGQALSHGRVRLWITRITTRPWA